jgi:hypothetical protein
MIKYWRVQPFDSLPAGDWEHFSRVLTKIDITLPDLNNRFSPTFGDRVYNELFLRSHEWTLH